MSPIAGDKEELEPMGLTKVDFSFVLASSVHDMKNSIGMLLNTLATMAESAPPKDEIQAQFFSTLEYEAARINSELVQLLSLYRMEEQQLTVVIDECYVRECLEEQLARNESLLNSRNISANLQCDDRVKWYFDNEIIGGVINNLIVNCARYAKQRLHIAVAVINDYLCIEVADDGDGYPKAMLGQASLNSALGYSAGSTRLGLVFARKAMALHKFKGRQGYLTITNGGSLSGGVIKLYLP
jgi:signal transduction histidine kinase